MLYISTQLFLEERTFLSVRFIVKSNDHGITEAISNTIRDITYVYIITPSYLRATSTRLHPKREKRREIFRRLPLRLPPSPPSNVSFPSSDSNCRGIIEAIPDRIRDVTCVYIYSCRCIRELFPDGLTSGKKGLNRRGTRITRLSSNLEICFRDLFGCIRKEHPRPCPCPIYPTSPPLAPPRRLHRDACGACAH